MQNYSQEISGVVIICSFLFPLTGMNTLDVKTSTQSDLEELAERARGRTFDISSQSM